MRTVVLQSYRTENVPGWIQTCLESVRGWAEGQSQAYRFVGDEIADRVPGWYRDKADGRWPIITDLGRLLLIREALADGFERAVWLDADVLVFDPEHLTLDVEGTYAFGREVWVQEDTKGRLRVWRNVHNAVCMFEPGNPMLDFYIHACLRVLERVEGGVPNQIVGTKLLTALHNMIGLPLTDQVAMFSPPVLADIASGGGPALDLLTNEAPGTFAAANLCGSLAGSEVPEAVLEQACTRLLNR